MSADKRIRVDQEMIDLANQYASILKRINGTNYYNYEAIKVALRKAIDEI